VGILNTNVKRGWTTIGVPEEVMFLLKRIKSKSGHNKAYWRILLESLAFYTGVLSSPRKITKVSKMEKVSWYIVKVSLTYSNFALNTNDEMFKEFISRLEEIEKRLGLDVNVLKRLAEEYKKLAIADLAALNAIAWGLLH